MRFLILFLLAASSLFAQAPDPAWTNVQAFGAKPDGVTDNSPAIVAAIQSAISTHWQQRDITIWFPPGYGYAINTPLYLPSHGGGMITLWFDAPLLINATVYPNYSYVFHGNASTTVAAYSSGQRLTYFGAHASPAIHITNKSELRFENIMMQDASGDGFLVDGDSSNITWDNVWGRGGIPVRIIGGFDFTFLGGGYDGNPSVKIQDDRIRCSSFGIITFERTKLFNHGIKAEVTCGPLNTVSINNVLFEGPQDAMFSVDTLGYKTIVAGVTIKDSNMADSIPPIAGCIDIKGSYVSTFLLMNCATDSPVIATGDPVNDLEIWTIRNDSPRVSQSSGYIIHSPSAIIDRMVHQ